MSRLDEQRAARLEKRKALERTGTDCYPATAKRTHTLGDLRAQRDALEKNRSTVVVVGRIMSMRTHGGLAFLTLQDGTGAFQIRLTKDGLGDAYRHWIENLDLGDIVNASGALFTTHRGEPTIQVASISLLTKSLRPIPDQHFGVKNVETRLRKRYLDLLANPELRDLFVKKNRFWQTARAFFTERGFLEVETPVLEAVPGGAETIPFVTHYNALDEDVFLRISLELPLKRLLVGGFERVFEIGRIFRNEGMSPEHLQDYAQLECYWAYADYHDLQTLVPDLFSKLASAVLGSPKVTSRGVTVDFAGAWQRYDYYDLFRDHAGIDLNDATLAQLRDRASSLHVPVEPGAGKGRVIDALYKKTVRPALIQPGFLLDPPVEVEPLAKRHPDNPGRVQRLQVVAWGTELGKGFSELNDPVDQRKRFEEQMALRAAGDSEAQHLDEDYLEALEYGMPPAAGFGMSERLFAVLMDKPVRETVIFPSMRGDDNSQKP